MYSGALPELVSTTKLDFGRYNVFLYKVGQEL